MVEISSRFLANLVLRLMHCTVPHIRTATCDMHAKSLSGITDMQTFDLQHHRIKWFSKVMVQTIARKTPPRPEMYIRYTRPSYTGLLVAPSCDGHLTKT